MEGEEGGGRGRREREEGERIKEILKNSGV
jgi:hypothetical protein